MYAEFYPSFVCLGSHDQTVFILEKKHAKYVVNLPKVGAVWGP